MKKLVFNHFTNMLTFSDKYNKRISEKSVFSPKKSALHYKNICPYSPIRNNFYNLQHS